MNCKSNYTKRVLSVSLVINYIIYLTVECRNTDFKCNTFTMSTTGSELVTYELKDNGAQPCDRNADDGAIVTLTTDGGKLNAECKHQLKEQSKEVSTGLSKEMKYNLELKYMSVSQQTFYNYSAFTGDINHSIEEKLDTYGDNTSCINLKSFLMENKSTCDSMVGQSISQTFGKQPTSSTIKLKLSISEYKNIVSKKSSSGLNMAVCDDLLSVKLSTKSIQSNAMRPSCAVPTLCNPTEQKVKTNPTGENCFETSYPETGWHNRNSKIEPSISKYMNNNSGICTTNQKSIKLIKSTDHMDGSSTHNMKSYNVSMTSKESDQYHILNNNLMKTNSSHNHSINSNTSLSFPPILNNTNIDVEKQSHFSFENSFANSLQLFD